LSIGTTEAAQGVGADKRLIDTDEDHVAAGTVDQRGLEAGERS
jgi:hypothetical protein